MQAFVLPRQPILSVPTIGVSPGCDPGMGFHSRAPERDQRDRGPTRLCGSQRHTMAPGREGPQMGQQDGRYRVRPERILPLRGSGGGKLPVQCNGPASQVVQTIQPTASPWRDNDPKAGHIEPVLCSQLRIVRCLGQVVKSESGSVGGGARESIPGQCRGVPFRHAEWGGNVRASDGLHPRLPLQFYPNRTLESGGVVVRPHECRHPLG